MSIGTTRGATARRWLIRARVISTSPRTTGWTSISTGRGSNGRSPANPLWSQGASFMGFQHPQQREHMMQGVRAAAKSPKTPLHLRPHLQNRLAPNVELGNKPQSTMEPDEDDLMDVSKRTPDGDTDDANEQVNPMQE